MGKVAYVFPGQGSQYAGMGRDLYEQSAAARAVFDAADEALGFALSKVIFEGPEEELSRTDVTQPALLTMEVACWEALHEAGAAEDAAFFAGHSLGEYAALVAADSVAFPDAVRLVRERGRLMQEAADANPGGMSAVIALGEDEVRAACEEAGAYPANFNCPGQIVISGTAEALKAAGKAAKARGAKMAIPLKVAGPFHSPLMQQAQDSLEAAIAATAIADPVAPVVGNTEAAPLTTAEQIREELGRQLCHCVMWSPSVEYLLGEGVDKIIEVGPGTVLAGLMKRIPHEGCAVASAGTAEDVVALATYAKEA